MKVCSEAEGQDSNFFLVGSGGVGGGGSCICFKTPPWNAGVIGCEFAAILANFGQTRVHLVNERRARLLPSEDEDVSNFIAQAYKVL